MMPSVPAAEVAARTRKRKMGRTKVEKLIERTIFFFCVFRPVVSHFASF